MLPILDLNLVAALILKQDKCVRTQTRALEAATWMFVPGEMLQRAWTAPMRSEWVFLRHRAAVRSARAGGIHVNHAPLSTQVSQPDPALSLCAFCVFFPEVV